VTPTRGFTQNRMGALCNDRAVSINVEIGEISQLTEKTRASLRHNWRPARHCGTSTAAFT